MYCDELNCFIFQDSGNPENFITSDGVTYSQDEAIRLARESVEDLRAIHKAKKFFKGVEETRKPTGNEWVKESPAVTALWKSRIFGPPERKRVQNKKKEGCKQTELFNKGEQ